MTKYFLLSLSLLTAIILAPVSAQVRTLNVPFNADMQNAPREVMQAPQGGASYTITPSDINIRKALSKWSRSSGWMFDSEHWTLPGDIPVSGSANLGNDFKAAVRSLMKSTEMTDMPGQPCFYANNVLRIIPVTELCTRQQEIKN